MLPLALLVARLVAGTGLRMAAGMLAMVLHESGHAITAWLTGRWAVPLLWVTPHGQERSWYIVLALAAAIVFGGFKAWKAQRWGWVVAAGAVLILQVIALCLPAGALIVFFGDGGAMVLATILMATFIQCAFAGSVKELGPSLGIAGDRGAELRARFLLWSGPYEDLPFGEIEGVNLSDPSLLTEMYGWSVIQMVDRYVRLGEVCLVALAGLYLWGLVSAYMEMAAKPSSEKPRILANR